MIAIVLSRSLFSVSPVLYVTSPLHTPKAMLTDTRLLFSKKQNLGQEPPKPHTKPSTRTGPYPLAHRIVEPATILISL